MTIFMRNPISLSGRLSQQEVSNDYYGASVRRLSAKIICRSTFLEETGEHTPVFVIAGTMAGTYAWTLGEKMSMLRRWGRSFSIAGVLDPLPSQGPS